MIKKLFLFAILTGFGFILWSVLSDYKSADGLNPISSYYAGEGLEEIGSANIVTAVVVTYRGLDTLGEVSILFLTASILGFFLVSGKGPKIQGRDTSEILKTASRLLEPIIIIFGIYVFVNGHLSPGGGFQGGAILASALILSYLANPEEGLNKSILRITESISGLAFIVIGILGIVYAGGFLDNRIIPVGSIGDLISAGVIPIIYIFVGMKVGAELSSIVTNLKHLPKTDAE
jgi:multicomponent Na+:H+ antiporter subunit B